MINMPVGRDSDSGSILVSMMVLLSLLSLSLLLVAQQVASQERSTTTRAFTRALFVADVGLQEVAYRMQTKAIAPPALVGQSTSWVPGTVPGGSGRTDNYEFSVTRTGPLTYLLRSRGTAEGRTRTVAQEFNENPQFPFAVFADKSIHFQGNGFIGSYTSNANGTPASPDPGNGTGYIGTNGKILTNGGVTSGGVALFNNEGGASCSGPVCSKSLPGFPKAAKFPIESADAQIAANLTACKTAQGGVLKDYQASKEGQPGWPKLTAGAQCFRSMILDKQLVPFPGSAANPVKVYVEGGNVDVITPIGPGAYGSAVAFQIYAKDAATKVRFDHKGVLVGALWAPRSDCLELASTFEGVNVYGSAICGTFGKDAGTKGNGNFQAMYDNSLGSIGSGVYSQGRFSEEAPS